MDRPTPTPFPDLYGTPAVPIIDFGEPALLMLDSYVQGYNWMIESTFVQFIMWMSVIIIAIGALWLLVAHMRKEFDERSPE